MIGASGEHSIYLSQLSICLSQLSNQPDPPMALRLLRGETAIHLQAVFPSPCVPCRDVPALQSAERKPFGAPNTYSGRRKSIAFGRNSLAVGCVDQKVRLCELSECIDVDDCNVRSVHPDAEIGKLAEAARQVFRSHGQKVGERLLLDRQLEGAGPPHLLIVGKDPVGEPLEGAAQTLVFQLLDEAAVAQRELGNDSLRERRVLAEDVSDGQGWNEYDH